MTKKYKCFNIDWDVDDPEDLKNLPTEYIVEIEVYGDVEDELDDVLSDILSNNFGYCHNGFKYLEI